MAVENDYDVVVVGSGASGGRLWLETLGSDHDFSNRINELS